MATQFPTVRNSHWLRGYPASGSNNGGSHAPV